jgi:hypothetical protein
MHTRISEAGPVALSGPPGKLRWEVARVAQLRRCCCSRAMGRRAPNESTLSLAHHAPTNKCLAGPDYGAALKIRNARIKFTR